MINKTKWILILFLFPFTAHSAEPCNPASWNINLNQFKQLELSYNKYVKVFNALLADHKQRPLLSKEFDRDELAILWRIRSRRDLLQTQLETSIKHREQLSKNAEELSKLGTQSILSANEWEKLAQSCKNADEMANQITAEWYHTTTNQLADDYNNLSSQFLGLANLYDKEANILIISQKEEASTN